MHAQSTSTTKAKNNIYCKIDQVTTAVLSRHLLKRQRRLTEVWRWLVEAWRQLIHVWRCLVHLWWRLVELWGLLLAELWGTLLVELWGLLLVERWGLLLVELWGLLLVEWWGLLLAEWWGLLLEYGPGLLKLETLLLWGLKPLLTRGPDWLRRSLVLHLLTCRSWTSRPQVHLWLSQFRTSIKRTFTEAFLYNLCTGIRNFDPIFYCNHVTSINLPLPRACKVAAVVLGCIALLKDSLCLQTWCSKGSFLLNNARAIWSGDKTRSEGLALLDQFSLNLFACILIPVDKEKAVMKYISGHNYIHDV